MTSEEIFVIALVNKTATDSATFFLSCMVTASSSSCPFLSAPFLCSRSDHFRFCSEVLVLLFFQLASKSVGNGVRVSSRTVFGAHPHFKEDNSDAAQIILFLI